MGEPLAKIWDRNYRIKRYNKLPFNEIVSYVNRKLVTFGENVEPSSIRCLDLGCGGGNNTIFLESLGLDVWAVDVSQEAVSLTQNIVSSRVKSQILQSSFLSLPFENNYFDFVIDRAAIGCNLSNELQQIFNEVHRVVKPLGELFSVDLCHLEHPDLNYGENLGNGDYVNFNEGCFFHASQIHAFSPNELKCLLSQYEGVSIEKVSKANCLENNKADIKSVSINMIATK